MTNVFGEIPTRCLRTQGTRFINEDPQVLRENHERATPSIHQRTLNSGLRI